MDDEVEMSSPEVDALKAAELKKKCSERGIKQSNKKGPMVLRLKKHMDHNWPVIVEATEDQSLIDKLVDKVKEEFDAPPDDILSNWLSKEVAKWNHEEVEEDMEKINWRYIRREAMQLWSLRSATEALGARAIETNAVVVLARGKWTDDLSARLLHTLVDPGSDTAMARLNQGNANKPNQVTDGGPRAELEDGNVWDTVIAVKFKDVTFKPENIDPTCGHKGKLDPSNYNPEDTPDITGAYLKGKFSSLKSLMAKPWNRWGVSGAGDVDSFVLFAEGNAVVMYMFELMQLHGTLMALSTRELPNGTEEGGSTGTAPASNDGRGGRGGRGTKGGDGTAIADALRALGGSTKTVDEEKELVKAQTEATRNEDIRGWMSIKASLPIDAQIKLDEKALAAIDAL
jgi:hypothetical protein